MAKKNRIYYDSTVGELLRKLRKKAKLTQAEMAERFGIAEWLYNRYEKDILDFDVEHFDYLYDHEENLEGLNINILKFLQVTVYSQDAEQRIKQLPDDEQGEAWAKILSRIAELEIKNNPELAKLVDETEMQAE